MLLGLAAVLLDEFIDAANVCSYHIAMLFDFLNPLNVSNEVPYFDKVFYIHVLNLFYVHD
jgi:hypothetical protein